MWLALDMTMLDYVCSDATRNVKKVTTKKKQQDAGKATTAVWVRKKERGEPCHKNVMCIDIAGKDPKLDGRTGQEI